MKRSESYISGYKDGSSAVMKSVAGAFEETVATLRQKSAEAPSSYPRESVLELFETLGENFRASAEKIAKIDEGSNGAG